MFGILALGAAAGIGILLLFVPETASAWLPAPIRLGVTAIGAAILGVALTSIVVRAHFAYRFGYLIKAAERIASGDYTGYVEPLGSSQRFGVLSTLTSTGFGDTLDYSGRFFRSGADTRASGSPRTE